MKELIKQLREQAQENIKDGQFPHPANWDYHEGVLISNKQAIDIAEQLEVTTYPPIVQAVLSILKHMNDAIKHQFACIDKDGEGSCCKENPICRNLGYWGDLGSKLYFFNFNEILSVEKDKNIWKTLLFHRTENGWKWIGNHENENNKNI